MIEIKSETTATVWQIRVEAGQLVNTGEIVAILESMKIEIPVTAPTGGVILEIRVEPLSVVEEGDVIAIIDPGTPT